MLPQAASPRWQQVLRTNITDINQLADFLELYPDQRAKLIARKGFMLNLPMRLARKMQKSTLDDPLFKQFVPTLLEEDTAEGFVLEPLQEQHCRPREKLLHKYHGRVLLVCTSACAMHCRYCFRQNFPYEVARKDFSEEMAYISADKSIKEVILSGGDPLSLPDNRLEELFQALSSIDHIKRIRFHTRFPIGIPERIDNAFCSMIEKIPKQVWFVVHINHPNELDEELFQRLSMLRKLGVNILNQAVLLRGVNDDPDILANLFEELADHGITPYYLHQLDRVQGGSHFEVALEKGQEIMRILESRLSGYALPKFVVEVPDTSSKQRIWY